MKKIMFACSIILFALSLTPGQENSTTTTQQDVLVTITNRRNQEIIKLESLPPKDQERVNRAKQEAQRQLESESNSPILLSPRRGGVVLNCTFPPLRCTTDTVLTAKPILKFKWHGYDPRGPGGAGCVVKKGICLIIPFILANRELTPEEIADDFGTADFTVDGNRLHMVFHREAALPDGTINIYQNKDLGSEVSRALGYDRIMLKAGIYRVNMSRTRFGETWVNIEKGKRIIVLK